MFNSPIRITIFIYTLLFCSVSYAQIERDSIYKKNCIDLFLEARKSVKISKDTIKYRTIYKELDDLILSQNDHEFYVRFKAFRGTILCMNGFTEGFDENYKAVEYGKQHLDSNSKEIANAYGNLAVSYHSQNDTKNFIKYTTISSNILSKNPTKNAGAIIQTNFNLEVYFVDNPDGYKAYAIQNDSLVHYLPEADLEIKALYYLKNSIKDIHNKKIQEAKKNIAIAIENYTKDTKVKPNIKKYYYRALATYQYLTKDYQDAIKNYKTYYELIKSWNSHTANTYIFNQVASSFKALNQLDSALYYSKKSYDTALQGHQEKKGSYNRLNLPVQAIQYLKLYKSVNGNYNSDAYQTLIKYADSIKDQPVTYLEFIQIQDEMNPKLKKFEAHIQACILNDNSNTIQSFYFKKYGQYKLEHNKYEQADSLFNLSLKWNKVNASNPNSIYYNYNLLKEVALDKHKLYLKTAKNHSHTEALKHYETVLRLLVSYLYENWDGLDKADILAQITQISNEAVEYCFQHQKNEDGIPYVKYALYFADQGNSILYKYNKRRIEALQNPKISKEDSERLAELRIQINEFLHDKNTNISQKIFIPIQNEYNRLVLKAEMECDAIIELENFNNFNKQISKLENAYDCILAFHVSDSVVFKITEEKGQYSIQKLQDSFKALKNHQNSAINALQNSNSKEFAHQSYRLFSKLFEDKNSIENKNILVVNSPQLKTFPFECLIHKPATEQDDFSSLPYLVYQTQFVYALGLSSDYSYSKSSNMNLPYVGIYSDTRDILKFAKKEIESINHILNGKYYNANTIAKRELEDQLKQAKIIHIASHNLVDTTNAYSSELILSDSSAENYKLYQIMNLDINPDLLILNACSTANGKYKTGEGKMSMARAFNYAGAKNVIVNSWDVSDYSVSKIMQSFFNYYPKKFNVNLALKQAKIDYLSNSDNLTANPLYWAGTIFVSKNTVNHNSNFIRLFLSIFGLSTLILILSFISNSKQKESIK